MLIPAVVAVVIIGILGLKHYQKSAAFGNCYDIPCAVTWASDVVVHGSPYRSGAYNSTLSEPGPYRADYQCRGGNVYYGNYANNYWIYNASRGGFFSAVFVSYAYQYGHIIGHDSNHNGNWEPIAGIPNYGSC